MYLQCRTCELSLVPKLNAIKSSKKDKVEGSFHNAKGKVKEIAGKVSNKSTRLCQQRYLK